MLIFTDDIKSESEIRELVNSEIMIKDDDDVEIEGTECSANNDEEIMDKQNGR